MALELPRARAFEPAHLALVVAELGQGQVQFAVADLWRGEVLRRVCPHIFVTTSHEILREFREYERTSTTALNAFVGPRVSRYLARFEGFARAR